MEGPLFDKEGHLFDGKGHFFWEGSQFCYKLLGGWNFDHVYEPLTMMEYKDNCEFIFSFSFIFCSGGLASLWNEQHFNL